MGWEKKLGRPAVITGAFCGLLPDLDVLSRLWGPWEFIRHHRGFSHSITFSLVWAVAGGLLLPRLLKSPRASPLTWMGLLFAATFTHPLLDLFTSYGTVLLWPFSDRRFYLDGAAIIDPLYTLPLLGVLLLKNRESSKLPKLLFLGTSLYLLFGVYVNGVAVRRAERDLRRHGVVPSQIRALPLPPSLLFWRILARDSAGYIYISPYNFIKPNYRWHRVEPLSKHLTPQQRKSDEILSLFEWFADGWTGYLPMGKNKIRVPDLRYGSACHPTDSYWGIEIFQRGKKIAGISYYRRRLSLQRIKSEISCLLR